MTPSRSPALVVASPGASAAEPCDGCRAALEALEARVAALEAERARGRVDEGGAFVVLVTAADGRWWSARSMIQRGRVDGRVYQALVAIAGDTPGALGAWCRAHRDQVRQGLRLVRGRRGEAGYLWRFLYVAP